MKTDYPISNRRAQPSSYSDDLKLWIQGAQVNMQRVIILFILHIILYLSSSQRVTRMRWKGGEIISSIRVHTVYYENSTLLSTNNSWVYDKEKHEHVKVFILYLFSNDSNTLWFESTRPTKCHSWVYQAQVLYMYVQLLFH